MARTKSFKELVPHHVKSDPQFAEPLLREGVDAMLSGDVETGKIILRDYIKATVGFEKLGVAAGAPPKSLIPHVWSARQPAGQEPFQRDRLSCKSKGACIFTWREANRQHGEPPFTSLATLPSINRFSV
jgi:hypothetical protein